MNCSSWTGTFTWWQISSKSSLKVCSSFLLVILLESSKLTSVKSIPIVLGIYFSKNLWTNSREIPLPSAVPVDLNSFASTQSISKEIQYWSFSLDILKWFFKSELIWSMFYSLQIFGSKIKTLFCFMSWTSSSSYDLIPK